MDFKEELGKVMKDAWAENEAEKQADRDFDAAWNKLKKELVYPVLKEAEDVFRENRLAARANITNGSVLLEADWYSDEFLYHFSVSPNKKEKIVLCSSSFSKEPPESFSIDKLSRGDLERMTKEFAYNAVKSNKDPQ